MRKINYILAGAMLLTAAYVLTGCGTTTTETGNTPAQWSVVGTAGFTGGVASYNSLAFNGTTPYLACVDSGLAKVFTYGSTWTQVTGNSGVGSSSGDRNTDIQFKTDAWVAFADKNAGSCLTVKKWTGIDWFTSTSNAANVVSYVYLSLDANNHPAVVYQDASSGAPHVVKYDGTSWDELGANLNASFTNSAMSLAIVVSSNVNATPYVAYRGGTGDAQLYVRYYSASTWQNVESSGLSDAEVEPGSSTSIAINPITGKVWVVYEEETTHLIKVVADNGTAWVSKGTASSGQGNYPTLAFASDGTAYVGFQDVANGNKATVVSLVGATWTPVVSAGFSAGTVTYTHLAIDSNNVPYLAFQDGYNGGKATVMKYVAAH